MNIQSRVVSNDLRSISRYNPRLRIDWTSVLDELESGSTLEITLPPHPVHGTNDNGSAGTSALLRNAVNKRFEGRVSLRSRLINRDKRLIVCWLEDR